jgi:tetratricopeptide (TPR) repeat protein
VQPFEEEARRHFNDGVQWELQGGMKGVELSAQPMYSLGDNPGLPSHFWMPAAREFQAAIAADKTLLQAHLHLGRIRMLEGKLDEALDLLGSATRAVDPRVRYLARLFSGSILERRTQFVEAEQRYREAIAEYPWGQAGRLALAQLLSRTGRDSEARGLLLERFSDFRHIVEPLWTYVILRPDDYVGALFNELRVEVGK